MDSYTVKLSIFFEFYYDYFKIIFYPYGVKPDIQSLNEKKHLAQFIIEYHNANDIKNMLEFFEIQLNEIVAKKEKTLS